MKRLPLARSRECPIYPFGWWSPNLYGGPYIKKLPYMVGVKMAAEINMPASIDIPTRDFSTPDPVSVYQGIRKLLPILARGESVYVGCMGGIGRTGLFLACVAKILGVRDPVGYVRRYYHPSAVETEAQRAFVVGFDSWKLRLLAYALLPVATITHIRQTRFR